MIEGVLVGLASLAVVVNLVYGMVLVWGLSGGDGEGTIVGGILALALFASLVWAMIQTMALLDPIYLAIVIGVLVVGSVVAMFVFGATDDRRRRRLVVLGAGAAVVLVVLIVGIGGGASIEDWRPVLITLLPPLLLAVALVVVKDEAPEEDGLVFLTPALLSIPPALLAVAQLTS